MKTKTMIIKIFREVVEGNFVTEVPEKLNKEIQEIQEMVLSKYPNSRMNTPIYTLGSIELIFNRIDREEENE